MRSMVFHVLLGIVAGIVMALVELLLLIPANFSLFSANFVMALVFGFVYPWCLQFLKKWSDHVWLVQIISIGLAAGIVLLYSLYMQSHMILGELPFQQIGLPSALVNGTALLSAWIVGSQRKD